MVGKYVSRFLMLASLISGFFLITPRVALSLEKPQIISVSPMSPQPVGTCITVKVETRWDDSYGSMHVRFGNEGWQESSETQFERVFCTHNYTPGVYKIRVEARDKNDNSWSHPQVEEIDYELKSIEDFFPGQIGVFGTARQVYPARIGLDIYVIRAMDNERWLVPSPETAKALCIPGDLQGNMWGVSQEDLQSIPRGPDIPDIMREPEKFWEFKNAYFLPCDPDGYLLTIPSQNEGLNQPVDPCRESLMIKVRASVLYSRIWCVNYIRNHWPDAKDIRGDAWEWAGKAQNLGFAVDSGDLTKGRSGDIVVWIAKNPGDICGNVYYPGHVAILVYSKRNGDGIDLHVNEANKRHSVKLVEELPPDLQKDWEHSIWVIKETQQDGSIKLLGYHDGETYRDQVYKFETTNKPCISFIHPKPGSKVDLDGIIPQSDSVSENQNESESANSSNNNVTKSAWQAFFDWITSWWH